MTQKTKSNEVVLLENRLEQQREATYRDASADEFFLVSSVDTILRKRGLSYQQIEDGVVEGADDGGIDAVYTFLNGNLVEDETAPSLDQPKIELEIIQAKAESGFKEVVLQRLLDHLPLLLQLQPSEDLSVEFNERVLERFSIFRSTYLNSSRSYPELSIRVYYVTKSVDPPNSKVESKKGRLVTTVAGRIGDAAVSVDFVGASALNSLARERINPVLELKVADGPISSDKGGWVCLVGLRDWHNFITDAETGRLRDDIFEENVRGYEGDTAINKEIAGTLRRGDESNADFWWLNNGVTALAERVRPEGKRLIIENPQIVNGLQTSRNVHGYFTSGGVAEAEGTGRRILVRVIRPENDAVVSEVIKATNSQNRVSVATLRATEPFQRDIEEYFKQRGYYYERKKNQYKKTGVSRAKIVEVLELAQAVASILLAEPNNARGKPSALVRDKNYGRVFNEKTPLAAYLSCVLIVREVESYLDKIGLNRPARSNTKFQMARVVAAFALTSSKPRANRVARIDPSKLDDEHLSTIYDWVVEARTTASATTGIEDFNTLAKGNEWTAEIDRKLKYYTEKTKWPKKIVGGWKVEL